MAIMSAVIDRLTLSQKWDYKEEIFGPVSSWLFRCWQVCKKQMALINDLELRATLLYFLRRGRWSARSLRQYKSRNGGDMSLCLCSSYHSCWWLKRSTVWWFTRVWPDSCGCYTNGKTSRNVGFVRRCVWRCQFALPSKIITDWTDEEAPVIYWHLFILFSVVTAFKNLY